MIQIFSLCKTSIKHWWAFRKTRKQLIFAIIFKVKGVIKVVILRIWIMNAIDVVCIQRDSRVESRVVINGKPSRSTWYERALIWILLWHFYPSRLRNVRMNRMMMKLNWGAYIRLLIVIWSRSILGLIRI